MPDVVDDLKRAESGKVRKTPRGSRKGLIILGALVVLLAVGAWAYFHFRNRVSTDDAQVDAHITSVAPRVSGTVLAVLVNDNQQVKAGDVLVRIDPRDYQARVDQAKAALLQAESQLRTAQTVVPLTNETT